MLEKYYVQSNLKSMYSARYNIKFAFVRACDQLFLLAVYSISDLKYAKWAQVD